MPCQTVRLPGGVGAIVCSPRARRRKRCRSCGKLLLDGELQCDWKLPAGRGEAARTCDAYCCPACAVRPRAGKDICPRHIEDLAAWFAEGEAMIENQGEA